MQKFSLVLWLAVAGLLIAGCSGRYASEEFVRADIDMASVTRVAVLPFANHSGQKFEEERVRNIVITQILALGIADVVDRGIVDSVMAEEVIDPRQPIDAISLRRLGQRLNVQAFMLGSVDLSDSKRAPSGGGDYPELALTLRLVEGQSGMVIWQNSGHWTAETVIGRIFGSAPTDRFHVALKLVRNMLKGLAN